MSFLASEASMDHQSSQNDVVAFDNVQLFALEDSEALSCDDTGDLSLKVISKDARLEVRQTDLRVVFVVTSNGGKQLLLAATWNKTDLEFSKAGQLSLVIQNESNSSSGQTASSAAGAGEWMHDSADRGCYLLRFAREADASSVYRILSSAKATRRESSWSVFERRTEASSAEQYFQFYSLLSQQQNMLQDYVRTSTYQRAMLANAVDFRDKVVMDVGAGSGILSFFAVQAGAKRVYAVEASASAAQYCETLVNANRLAGRIIVIRGKLEEIELDEQVDVLISEPLGYMLLNERMLETFLHAKKFLRVDKAKSKTKSDSASAAGDTETSGKHPLSVGRLFPSRSDLYIAPFSDEVLFTEVQSKANFWHQPSFYGCVNLCALRDAAQREYFRQPVVDTFDMRVCCAPPVKHTVDFASAEETDLVRIDVPLRFVASQSTTVHGLAFWFDVAFAGSTTTVWLSTSPTEPLTHWYQVRCLVPTPIFVHAGQILTGRLLLNANSRQSYDVDIELELQGVSVNGCDLPERTIRARNSLDLKNPLFRYTGAPVQPPPGCHTQQSSPTELFWQAQQTAAAAAYNPAAALGISTAPYAVPVTGTQTVVNGALPQTAAFPAVALQNGAIVNQQFVPVAATSGYNVLLGSNSAHSLYGTTMQQFAS